LAEHLALGSPDAPHVFGVDSSAGHSQQVVMQRRAVATEPRGKGDDGRRQGRLRRLGDAPVALDGAVLAEGRVRLCAARQRSGSVATGRAKGAWNAGPLQEARRGRECCEGSW